MFGRFALVAAALAPTIWYVGAPNTRDL